MRDKLARTLAKLMAPFLAPAAARIERRLDRANILSNLLLRINRCRKVLTEVDTAPNAWQEDVKRC